MKLTLAFLLVALFASALAENYIIRVRPVRDLNRQALRNSNLPRKERRQAVYDQLTSLAAESQAPLLSLLKENGIKAKSFWISNSIFVANAPANLVQLVEKHESVLEVRPEKHARLITPVERSPASDSMFAPGWNIDLINAPSAWNITRGEGIVVANIDTGVRYTHQSLIGSYRGNFQNGSFSHDYNWFDSRGTASPSDGNGHGTHTMGTIVGSEASGVGVAPGAQWFAGKGCGTILCSEEDLTGSAEFVLCPTRLDGSEPDCSLGADVVSNSWGGGQGDDWYMPYVDAWRDAGMIPVFAQGNSGPQCATANSPGDMDTVIGVGASDSSDSLARFSSRGEGPNLPGFSRVKPDITAPGAAIRSASNSADGTYTSLSGTSMACPHVAGLVALILSANQGLSYDEVYSIVTKTAVTRLGAPAGGTDTCDGIHYSTIPSNHYGYGRIDALASVTAAKDF